MQACEQPPTSYFCHSSYTLPATTPGAPPPATATATPAAASPRLSHLPTDAPVNKNAPSGAEREAWGKGAAGEGVRGLHNILEGPWLELGEENPGRGGGEARRAARAPAAHRAPERPWRSAYLSPPCRSSTTWDQLPWARTSPAAGGQRRAACPSDCTPPPDRRARHSTPPPPRCKPLGWRSGL